MKKIVTKEPQYQICVDLAEKDGAAQLGLMTNQVWQYDPKRLTFVLSRYKFVSKMLAGTKRVVEIGCADAFGTRIVAAEVGKLTALDFDPIFIEDAARRQNPKWKFECIVHDILDGPPPGTFDAAFSLDVLEHIHAENEDKFVKNIVASLTRHGVLIVGSPSINSLGYASPPSRRGHVNCKDHKQLKALFSKYFNNVFIFSMNDEVVHTGFYPMAHYLIAVCCSPKTRKKA